MAGRLIFAAIFFAFLIPSGIGAQMSAASPSPTWQDIAFPAFNPVSLDRLQSQEQLNPAAPAQTPAQKVPEPYEKDEFPQWAQDLWRGCIIAAGSFPFTYFFTLEGYDLYRYTSQGFNPLYAPWPFIPASDIIYSDQEKIGLIVTAISASLLVAVADYLIGVFSENR
jgi:hypothetical protein